VVSANIYGVDINWVSLVWFGSWCCNQSTMVYCTFMANYYLSGRQRTQRHTHGHFMNLRRSRPSLLDQVLDHSGQMMCVCVHAMTLYCEYLRPVHLKVSP
jgi:hypothetical protein